MSDQQLERFPEIQNPQSDEEWLELYEMYNNLWGTEVSYCSGCTGTKNAILKKLARLYEKQRDDIESK